MAQISSRERADGSTAYRVRWRLGGTRLGEWQSETFSNETRAEAFLLDVEEAGHQWPKGWVKGRGYVAAAERPTTLTRDVAGAYFEWQRRRVALNKLTAYTLERYEANWRLHLDGQVGDLPFEDLSDEHIELWVDEVSSEFKPKSVRNWHGLLFAVAKYGSQKMRLRPDNPCAGTDLPDPEDLKQIRFFQHGEWALFRANLKADVHPLVDLLLVTGMRWGEVSALRVEDLEFDDDVVSVHIHRAWSKRAREDTAAIKSSEGETRKWKLGPPKGRKERRVVAVGPVVQELREQIRGKKPSAYVFTTRMGNPWRHTDFYSDRWKPAATAVAERIPGKLFTPHMLRHTAVVWALAEGVPIEVISERLGHASIQITYDVYGGLLDQRDPSMAMAIARGMLTAQTAVVSAPSREEVETRVLRPGRRGEARRRVS